MSGETLDVFVGHPTCKAFDIHLDDVPTRLIVAQGADFVSTVLVGSETVWKGAEGERCTYLTVHFDGAERNNVLMVYLHKESAGRPEHKLFKKVGGEWVNGEGFGASLVELREKVDKVAHFTLEVGGAPVTQADFFEAQQFRVPTRFFFPKLGQHAVEVTFGGETVWKAEGERVFLSKIHLKDGEPALLYIHGKKEDEGFSSVCFTPKDGKWEKIESKEYGAILATLKL